MSHGPSITVYNLNVDSILEKKEEILNYMIATEIGTVEERNCVSKYITGMLANPIGEEYTSLFAYWNHRPDQEVDDYDVLCDLFEEYGKILSHVTCADTIVSADYRDYFNFCRDGDFFKLSDKDSQKIDQYMNVLKLKYDVIKGKEAQMKLSGEQ